VAEPIGPRLLTIHNVAWTLALVERIRAAIVDGSLAGLRAEVAERWQVEGSGTLRPDGGTGDTVH
jgi:tRNA-guanine family transglycosylase